MPSLVVQRTHQQEVHLSVDVLSGNQHVLLNEISEVGVIDAAQKGNRV